MNTILLKDVKVQAQVQVRVGVATTFLTDAKRRVECIFVVQEDGRSVSDKGDYDDNTSISVSTSTTTRYIEFPSTFTKITSSDHPSI